MITSRLYEGRVEHHRFATRDHRFAYEVPMFFLVLDDLARLRDEVPALRFEGNVTGADEPRRSGNVVPGHYVLRRGDFLPQYDGDLLDAARALYREMVGTEAPGPVAMLANLRSLGWNFNPITVFFYYRGDDVVEAIAEVTNTPWGERHCYRLGPPGTIVFDKAHHVSPFLTMAGRYRLTYRAPADTFTLSMTLYGGERDGVLVERRLQATMSFRATSLTAASLRRLAWRHPAAALQVSTRIYLQAARLFAKGVKFVAHPKHQPKERVLGDD